MLTLFTGDNFKFMACTFRVTLQTDMVTLQHLNSMLSNKLLCPLNCEAIYLIFYFQVYLGLLFSLINQSKSD